jgi:hypothetical protein
MAKKLDTNYQRRQNEIIFPKCRRKVKNENKPHTKLHGYRNGTWKNKSILPTNKKDLIRRHYRDCKIYQ